MNIGKTIKKLRRERNMTQERLATFLNISPQAVSRWENGLAMPELSLVPVIANLFGVTTDLLFGLDGDNIDKAIEAIIKRADDAESERDHNVACISILEEGICKYPSNWQLKTELLERLYDTYCAYKEKAARDTLEKAINIGCDILDNCTVDVYRYSAIEILSTVYSLTGDKVAALETALRLPESSTVRDRLLMALSDDVDKADLIRSNINKYIELVGTSLRTLASSDDEYSFDEKIIIYNKIIKIYESAFESESDMSTELLCDVHRYLAALYADKKDVENTLLHLNKQAEILDKLANRSECEPSILRKEYLEEKTIIKPSEDVDFLADEMIYKLENRRYDFIRNTPEFNALINKLEGLI